VTPAQCAGKYVTYTRSLTVPNFEYAAPAVRWCPTVCSGENLWTNIGLLESNGSLYTTGFWLTLPAVWLPRNRVPNARYRVWNYFTVYLPIYLLNLLTSVCNQVPRPAVQLIIFTWDANEFEPSTLSPRRRPTGLPGWRTCVRQTFRGHLLNDVRLRLLSPGARTACH